MAINFEQKENLVKAFIEVNLPDYLESAELEDFDKYIDDFLDFDKYKYNKELFYNFSSYRFNDLSNESNSASFEMSLYVVLKGDTAPNLREKLLKYAACIYKLFEDTGNNFGGIFDIGMIDTVDFYNAAEGHKELKVCEISFTFQVEA